MRNLVLLGDIHTYRLWLWPWHLFSKRLLGQANLWFNRRRHFRMRYLPDLLERVQALEPDMMLFSGDLTMTALVAEFKLIQTDLAPLLEAHPALIVPGNHDRYTFTAARGRRFEEFFGPWTGKGWPHYQRLGEGVHLIGLDPTRPNMLSDNGLLGPTQREAIQGLIDEHVGPEDRLIVLCHYTLGTPPGYPREHTRHSMLDAPQLIELLGEAGRPTLYLHGHVHQPWCWRLPSAPNVLAVDAGAPVLTGPHHPQGQGFWQIRVPDSTEADHPWQLIRHIADKHGDWQERLVELPEEAGSAAPLNEGVP